jgi:uncharacterized membrane protein YoaK (UPF0700 family)
MIKIKEVRKMKKKQIAPNGLVILGFVLLNVLAGVFYRYNEVFDTEIILYMWILLVAISIVILFWGFVYHFEPNKVAN